MQVEIAKSFREYNCMDQKTQWIFTQRDEGNHELNVNAANIS